MSKENLEEITLGAGCFWCVEAMFQQLKGVQQVVSGYSNGHTQNPTYKEVCSGHTGHAEVARITFDPKIISTEDILKIFWTTHDPTTLNRQGNDVGTQYRSGVYYHTEEQKELTERLIKEFAPTLWDNPIVTEIKAIDNYYPAEDYHQNYFNDNPNQGYCSVVVAPKVLKFKKLFADRLKSSDA